MRLTKSKLQKQVSMVKKVRSSLKASKNPTTISSMQQEWMHKPQLSDQKRDTPSMTPQKFT
jgi:hypothetical protein